MYSFSFPNMFTTGSAKLVEDKAAIRSNLVLLLSSEQKTLFGDPYFGCQLRKCLYEQSDSLIVDILIDHIYTTIKTFMPQVYLSRKDIRILAKRTSIVAEIRYYHVLDNTSDLFSIRLTETAE